MLMRDKTKTNEKTSVQQHKQPLYIRRDAGWSFSLVVKSENHMVKPTGSVAFQERAVEALSHKPSSVFVQIRSL